MSEAIVQHRREGQQRLHTGIPGKLIGLDRVGQSLAGEFMVLIRPASGIGNLVGKSRGRKDLRQQGVRIERNARYQRIELLGRVRRRRLREYGDS